MYRNLQNLFLLIFGLIAFGLGIWGFYAAAGSKSLPFSVALFGTVDLIRGGGHYKLPADPPQLVIAQFALPLVALLAAGKAFLAGLRRDLRVALARRKRDHTIVCGLGDRGMHIIHNLRAVKQEVVAIDLSNDTAHAAACERLNVPVLKGDAKNLHVLEVAGLRRAKMAVMCTGSDAENVDIALRIKEFAARPAGLRSARFLALVELRSDWLFSRLINHDKQPLSSPEVELRLFNTYANTARMLVNALSLPPAPELAARTFAIVGFGAMGREVALHLLRAFPVALDQKFKLLVFDRDAEAARQNFMRQFPAADSLAEIEFVVADLQTNTADLDEIVRARLTNESLLGIAVCLANDDGSLFAALRLRSLLDQLGCPEVTVHVRLEHHRRLGTFAGTIERVAGFPNRIQAIGALEDLLSPGILISTEFDDLARGLHDDYRQRPKDELNPQADVPWHELPEFLKMSNRWRADDIPIMLALAGFHIDRNVAAADVATLTVDERELLAQLEHRRYTIERRLIGGQLGDTRRQPKRESAQLIGWGDLSESQRAWNRTEVARLPQILADQRIALRRRQIVRAYGDDAPQAAARLEAARQSAEPVHYVVIADIDRPDGIKAAQASTGLPSVSLWLASREEPEGLTRGKAQGVLAELLPRTEGWIRSDRLESANPAEPLKAWIDAAQ